MVARGYQLPAHGILRHSFVISAEGSSRRRCFRALPPGYQPVEVEAGIYADGHRAVLRHWLPFSQADGNSTYRA